AGKGTGQGIGQELREEPGRRATSRDCADAERKTREAAASPQLHLQALEARRARARSTCAAADSSQAGDCVYRVDAVVILPAVEHDDCGLDRLAAIPRRVIAAAARPRISQCPETKAGSR